MVDNTVLAESLDDLPNHDRIQSTQYNCNGALQSLQSSSAEWRRTILRKSKIDAEDTIANDAAKNGQNLTCTVHFLDNTVHEFHVEKNSIGEDLLTKVFEYLELMERDIFSLQFISLLNSSTARMRWLDAKKSIKRQIVCPPYQLFFRVKFYVSDPNRLIEDYTRYLLYLQIRKDFLDGKLSNPNENFDIAFLLASFAAQAEFGDTRDENKNIGSEYCGEESAEYLHNFKFLPAHPPKFEERVAKFHRMHRGLTTTDAEFNFCLYAAKRVLLYGFDLYNAKDGNGRPILIGVNHEGISVLDNTVIVNRFPWNVILKLSFKRKNFFLRIRKITAAENDGKEDFYEELELSFNAVCARNCKMLWKSCIEHHTFFRLPLNLCQLSSNLHNSVNSNISAAFRFNRLFHFRNKARASDRENMQITEKISKNSENEEKEKLSNRKRCHFNENPTNNEFHAENGHSNNTVSTNDSSEMDDDVTVRIRSDISTSSSLPFEQDEPNYNNQSGEISQKVYSDCKANDIIRKATNDIISEKANDIFKETEKDIRDFAAVQNDIYESNGSAHLGHNLSNSDYYECYRYPASNNNDNEIISSNINKFHSEIENRPNFNLHNYETSNAGDCHAVNGYYQAYNIQAAVNSGDTWRECENMRAMLNSTSSTPGISTTNDSSSSLTLLPGRIPSPAPAATSPAATPKRTQFEFPQFCDGFSHLRPSEFQLLSNSDGNDSTTSLMSSSMVFEGEFETLGSATLPSHTNYGFSRTSGYPNDDDHHSPDNISYDGTRSENTVSIKKMEIELSSSSSDSEVELDIFISQNSKMFGGRDMSKLNNNGAKSIENFEDVKVGPGTLTTMLRPFPAKECEGKSTKMCQDVRASISPSLSTSSLCCTIPQDTVEAVFDVGEDDNYSKAGMRNATGDDTDEDSSLYTLPYDGSMLEYVAPMVKSDRLTGTTAKLTTAANVNSNNNIADASSVKLRRNSLVLNSGQSKVSSIPPISSITVGNGTVVARNDTAANGKCHNSARPAATAMQVSAATTKNNANLPPPPKVSNCRQPPPPQPQLRAQQNRQKADTDSRQTAQQSLRPASNERSKNSRNSLPATATDHADAEASQLDASNTSSLPRPRRIPSISIPNSPRLAPLQGSPMERIPPPPSPAKPPSKIIFVVPVTAQQLFNNNNNNNNVNVGGESNFENSPSVSQMPADSNLMHRQRFSISSTSSASSSASMNRRQLSPLRILPNHSPIPLKITHANANANSVNGNSNNLANGFGSQNGSQTSLVGFLLPESSLLNITNVTHNANYCYAPMPNCCPSPSTSNGVSPSGSLSSQFSMTSAQNNNNKVNNNNSELTKNNENHRKLSQQSGNARLRTAQKLTQQIRLNSSQQQPKVEQKAKQSSKIEDPYAAPATIYNNSDCNQRQTSTTIGDNRNNNNSSNYQSILPYSRANNKLNVRPQSVLQIPLGMAPYNAAVTQTQLTPKTQLSNGSDASLLKRGRPGSSSTTYYRHSPLPSSSSSAQNHLHCSGDDSVQRIKTERQNEPQRSRVIQLNGNKVHAAKSNLQIPPSPPKQPQQKSGEQTEFPVSLNGNFESDTSTNSFSKPTNSIYLKRRNSVTKCAETNNASMTMGTKNISQANRISQSNYTEQQQKQHHQKQQEHLLNQSLNQIIANGKKCAAVDENVKCSPRPLANNTTNNTASLANGHSNKFNGNVSQANGFNVSQSNGSGTKNNGGIAVDNSASTVNGLVVARIPSETFQHSKLHITGGADCAHPAIISRIAASTTIPLNEGDQVVRINGLDIAHWSHAEVTSFLQKMRENPKDMVLIIRPNVYRCGELVADQDENQTQQCAALLDETLHVADTVPRSDKLAQSMAILNRMLESNSLSVLFDQVYRKKPGLSMDSAHRPENVVKNRYRDVCPYDATRVKLRNAPSGDYINANHINMEIQSSGIINRYIATQGPLPQTTADFWWMIWEHSSTTIVMLTTVMEKGRVKCHQYWPEADGKPVDFGHLQLTNVSERMEPHCRYREISIRHKVSKEERLVTQMQYTAWPDHGVPENPQHFIKFVGEVRAARKGSIEPIIVHCSAGIGRTGVLIMMETAACMIEANEPVYPLDIMRIMRDQRAMLIQTMEQFGFVCESILRSFSENNVEPLAEYQRNRSEIQRK